MLPSSSTCSWQTWAMRWHSLMWPSCWTEVSPCCCSLHSFPSPCMSDLLLRVISPFTFPRPPVPQSELLCVISPRFFISLCLCQSCYFVWFPPRTFSHLPVLLPSSCFVLVIFSLIFPFYSLSLRVPCIFLFLTFSIRFLFSVRSLSPTHLTNHLLLVRLLGAISLLSVIYQWFFLLSSLFCPSSSPTWGHCSPFLTASNVPS